jgi:type IV secretion system protein VirB9
MKRCLVIYVIGFVCFCSVSAYGDSRSRNLLSDHHMKLVSYDPNHTVILKGRYGYQTHVIFATNEIIQHVSLGDSLAWQVAPITYHLFIKPVTSSKTNMTVLTNLRHYTFQLDSTNPTGLPTYQLQFIYADGEYDQSHDTHTTLSFDPNQLNWKYSFTGDRFLSPTTAFDNGQFTFFKFKQNNMSHLPAIFMVNQKQQEMLVDYHMQDYYMVIHAVAKQFTLRDGPIVTSVYNDKAIGDWQTI